MATAVFADPSREDDHIGAPQFDQVSSQVMPNRGHVNIQCQLGVTTAGGDRRFQIAHVATGAAEARQSTLRSQDIDHLGQRSAGALDDHGQGKRIEIPHPIILRQAGLRAHAHAGCYALPVANRA